MLHSRHQVPTLLVIAASGLLRYAMGKSRPVLARDIRHDTLKHACDGVTTLNNRIDACAADREDSPKQANDDPSSEELLREDVAGSVHGHRPEHEQGDGKGASDSLRDQGFPLELFL